MATLRQGEIPHHRDPNEVCGGGWEEWGKGGGKKEALGVDMVESAILTDRHTE